MSRRGDVPVTSGLVPPGSTLLSTAWTVWARCRHHLLCITRWSPRVQWVPVFTGMTTLRSSRPIGESAVPSMPAGNAAIRVEFPRTAVGAGRDLQRWTGTLLFSEKVEIPAFAGTTGLCRETHWRLRRVGLSGSGPLPDLSARPQRPSDAPSQTTTPEGMPGTVGDPGLRRGDSLFLAVDLRRDDGVAPYPLTACRRAGKSVGPGGLPSYRHATHSLGPFSCAN